MSESRAGEEAKKGPRWLKRRPGRSRRRSSSWRQMWLEGAREASRGSEKESWWEGGSDRGSPGRVQRSRI